MQNEVYSTWLEVDLEAIRNNVRQISKISQTQVMAVIKANGYGHGAEAVARAALQAGAAWCGVARIEEALALREAHINGNLMVLGFTPPACIPQAIEKHISIAVYDWNMARKYLQYAQKTGGQLKLHIKVETGMGRLGMQADEVPAFIQWACRQPQFMLEGIFTHFARADEPHVTSAKDQVDRFNHVLAVLNADGICPPIKHAANSAALFNLPEAHYDLVRPGIAMYGLNPSAGTILPDHFKPALTWKAQITSIRMMPPGHGISYGHLYITAKDERIGVIPIGYGDGFRRLNGQKVLVHGQVTDVIGRVCMDQSMIQLDALPEAVVGDEVVLLGRQGKQSITAEDLAARWGIVNYEVVCGLMDRLPRIYFNE